MTWAHVGCRPHLPDSPTKLGPSIPNDRGRPIALRPRSPPILGIEGLHRGRHQLDIIIDISIGQAAHPVGLNRDRVTNVGRSPRPMSLQARERSGSRVAIARASTWDHRSSRDAASWGPGFPEALAGGSTWAQGPDFSRRAATSGSRDQGPWRPVGHDHRGALPTMVPIFQGVRIQWKNEEFRQRCPKAHHRPRSLGIDIRARGWDRWAELTSRTSRNMVPRRRGFDGTGVVRSPWYRGTLPIESPRSGAVGREAGRDRGREG